VREDILDAYVFVPEEHMAQLVSSVASGRIKIISFVGTPLKWRKGLVRSINLSTEVEEDLP
jgi:hypothetical protein